MMMMMMMMFQTAVTQSCCDAHKTTTLRPHSKGDVLFLVLKRNQDHYTRIMSQDCVKTRHGLENKHHWCSRAYETLLSTFRTGARMIYPRSSPGTWIIMSRRLCLMPVPAVRQKRPLILGPVGHKTKGRTIPRQSVHLSAHI